MSQEAAAGRDGWQLLAAHLEETAALARQLACAARPADAAFAQWAEAAGLLHDFGKYGPKFQKMLTEGVGRPWHAIHGPMLSHLELGSGRRSGLVHFAEIIAGRHAGLADREALFAKLNTEVRYREEASLLRDVAAQRPYSTRR